MKHIIQELAASALAALPDDILPPDLRTTVPGVERTRDPSHGDCACNVAMQLARAFTGKDMILKFEGAYHGNHDYALTSTFPPSCSCTITLHGSSAPILSSALSRLSLSAAPPGMIFCTTV